MDNRIKAPAILSVILVCMGIFYMVLLTNITLSGTCQDFSMTGMVTGEQNECTEAFKTQILPFSVWIILWGVLCFFIFLIAIEYFLTHLKKRKNKHSNS